MPKDKTESHEKIISAARREFLARGFEDASMRRIAADAGLTVSALYKHFPGKEEMFAALVQPAVDAFMGMYHRVEREAFSEAGSVEKGHIWKDKKETQMVMEFIYDHLDEFVLIVTKSRGTAYESFVHEIARKEEETTLRYMELLRARGIPVKTVNRQEFHLLVTANINAIFEAVRHGFTREEAMHYAETLENFWSEGWKQLFGY
ncbi:MAG: TetR/AcrR family transcriptional regulator [Solobacterium sp.]|nr:TetR/AcrR family transcriptional regulator [Solobacterium sp.]